MRLLTFESPTQCFRIGLCVFWVFGFWLVALVDCLFAVFGGDFQHVGGFWGDDVVLFVFAQSCVLLLLHVGGFGLQERLQGFDFALCGFVSVNGVGGFASRVFVHSDFEVECFSVKRLVEKCVEVSFTLWGFGLVVGFVAVACEAVIYCILVVHTQDSVNIVGEFLNPTDERVVCLAHCRLGFGEDFNSESTFVHFADLLDNVVYHNVCVFRLFVCRLFDALNIRRLT